MNKDNYEFLFPPLKTQEKKTAKKEEVATDSNPKQNQKKTEDKADKKANS